MTEHPQHMPTEQQWDALDAALDVTETRWEPKPGDKLMGRIDRLDVYNGQDGGAYIVVRLEARDGSGIVTFSTGPARLKNELHRQKAQPGDLLALKYGGKQTNERTGREYQDWRVAVAHVGPRDPAQAFQLEPEPESAVGSLTPAPDDVDDDSEPPF